MESRIEAFTRLSADDRQALAALSQNVRYVDSRRDLISEGDKPKYVHLVLDGWGARYKTLPDGKRQIVSLFLPGDFCDLNVYILKQMDHSIGAITRLKVAMITPDEMTRLTHERPRVTQALWWHELVTTAIQREWTLNLGQRTAYERLGHLLVELYLRLRTVGLASNGRCDFPLTQNDLGEATDSRLFTSTARSRSFAGTDSSSWAGGTSTSRTSSASKAFPCSIRTTCILSMKDDTSTPIPDGSSAEFEKDKPGTAGCDAAEAAIEELRKRGGVFVDAVRATRMPMLLTDPSLAGNPIVFANDAFLRLSGYRMEEVLGQQPNFMDGPGTDPKDAARFAEALRSDHDDIIEAVQYRKNGSSFVATVLISAFKDEQGQTLHHFMSWLDATRRVEAENEVADLKSTQSAIRESDTRHRLLIESWAQAVWETDSEGVVVKDTPSWRAYTGQTLEECLGYGWLDAIHPDDRAYAERQWREAIAARGVLNAEFRIRAPDGSWRWTNVRAAPVLDRQGAIEKWAGMNIDIDARKRADEALRESEERYRMLFESMDEAYAVIEVLKDRSGKWADFRFLEVNPAFMEHTTMPYPVGKTATELLGSPNPRWTELYGQALDSGEPLRLEESEGTLGLTFDLNIFSLDRAKNRVAVLFTNITERKQSEEALRRSERRANTLLAELQHRVRNTLAAVRSIAQRTADNTSTAEEMLAHFQGRLDAFSRVQSVLTRSADAKVDLTSLIEDELVAHAARDGDQIRIDGPSVALDPRAAERMSLAIHELTTNAVKHGALFGEHGRISIHWQKQQNGGVTELVLSWKETGVTIAADDVRRDGFGMELLRHSLPYDLDAETTVSLEPTGLRFEIRMQLSADAA